MDVTQNLLPFKVTTFVMSLILCLDLFQTEKSLLVSKLHFAALHQICSNADTQFVAVALVADSLQPHASTFIEIMHWPYFIVYGHRFQVIKSKFCVLRGRADEISGAVFAAVIWQRGQFCF